ncbi:hypothetical protein BDN72DRAFT_965814 [Pluteus cervinus]|uniref:Uncharacterized protein n=1 Tax=Pluteus cervinus TaxID=181527 RepID=A0ACD3A461_9AGAR|nr:hypothetical protein BDN72DRAFT_965814 [Pluteus cervinus]
MHLISPYAKFSPAIRDVKNNPCPVSIIPIELLQEIFAFSVTKRSAPRIRASVSQDELEPPGFQATALILTWVCSQWRQIALSLQELWCTMNIYKPKKYCVELAKVYLSRSGDRTSLNLYLRQNARPDYWEYPNPEACPEHRATVEILRLWVPHAHRWRSIFLDMTFTPPSHELPKIPAGALSSLQEANLRFQEKPKDSSVLIEWLWGNLFQSPLLRTAYWHDLRHILPPAPFSQLSEFRLSSPTVDELYSVLAASHRLKRLDVNISPKDHTHPEMPSAPGILLPSLEYLALDGGEHLSRILDHLSAPALRELRLTDTREIPFAEAHSLERFLRRSCCTLRALDLTQGRKGGETSVLDYFTNASKYLANLEAFSVYCTALSERMISLFAPRVVDNTISVPFPCLVDLQFCTCITKDGVVSSMVNSRSAAGVPLWAFVCRVQYESTGYSKDEAVFQRLLQDGLQLYWYVW